MSETSSHEEQEHVQAQPPMPGQRLQQEREARGMTVQEVASRLRLATKVIKALEADDYDALPSMTFVNGYLRTYARLLELPLQDLNLPAQTLKQPKLMSTVATASQPSSRDFPVRMVTILVVLVMVASAVFWWVKHADELLFSRQGGAELSMPSLAPSGADSLALPALDTSTAELAVSAGEHAEPATPLSSGPASLDTSPATPQAATVTPPSTTQAPPVTAPATPVQAAPSLPAQANLTMRYSADSWSEVRDNTGRRLVHGVIQSGRVLELTGEAPFSFILGYAPGVQIEINGESFDHSPFQRQGVARFSAGEAARDSVVSR